MLSFIAAPDYENPQDVDVDNVYDVEVSATDPSGASVSLSYVITVNNVSEPETISGTVVDGLVSGATVNLMDAEGNVVASTTTIVVVEATTFPSASIKLTVAPLTSPSTTVPDIVSGSDTLLTVMT